MELSEIFAREIADPSEDFVKFFASEVYSGTKKTQSVIAQFKKMVKTALNQFIREKINDRLKSALDAGVEEEPEEKTEIENLENDDGIVTTQEEIDGYNTVKAILGETVDLNRVFMRDTKSYCGILLDDNNRKPICRLRFNSPTAKRLGVFKQKKETKHPVENVNDIYNYSEDIKVTVLEYLESEKPEQEA